MNQTIYEIKDIMQIMKISRNTAYRLINENKIPHIRIGNRYKIPVDAFNSWISLQDKSVSIGSPA